MARNDQQEEAQVQADNVTAVSPVQAYRFSPDELNGGLNLTDATDAQRNAALKQLHETGTLPSGYAFNVHWPEQVRRIRD